MSTPATHGTRVVVGRGRSEIAPLGAQGTPGKPTRSTAGCNGATVGQVA
jgi:hypothetical protein